MVSFQFNIIYVTLKAGFVIFVLHSFVASEVVHGPHFRLLSPWRRGYLCSSCCSCGKRRFNIKRAIVTCAPFSKSLVPPSEPHILITRLGGKEELVIR